ncbi:OsmC family protein [Paenibacillus sp. S-38]|uniref:OsmC family protein n=1 Tax=Paenibacillus sp. S-38 TaxID=3416710 RepID=UPI003CEC3465
MKIQIEPLQRKQLLGTAGTHRVVLDQPAERGGDDGGFRPTELWLIGLSGCAAGTLKGLAREKGFALDRVSIEAVEETNGEGTIFRVTFHTTLEGALTDEERDELLREVKGRCKVVKTVHPSIHVEFLDARKSSVLAGVGGDSEQQEPPEACSAESGACCI